VLLASLVPLIGSPCVDAPAAHTLTVVITGIRSDVGRVGVALYESPRGFPYQLSQALRTGFVDIHDGRSVITFRLLKPGTYAVTAFQDENNNERLDRDWLGFLAERTAVSNNPKAHIGRPTFDAAKFTMRDSSCIAIRFQ
jgi:uncharacterized protein (DUF2141 family)